MNKSRLLVLFCAWLVWTFYFNLWLRGNLCRYFLWLSVVLVLIKIFSDVITMYIPNVRKLDADIILFCLHVLPCLVNVILEEWNGEQRRLKALYHNIASWGLGFSVTASNHLWLIFMICEGGCLQKGWTQILSPRLAAYGHYVPPEKLPLTSFIYFVP